ncbi:T9SS type A sorting domain-containing protein [Flavobacterium sp. CS20]|uniref:T9SS type A sorting domain-containing protein n=1 Tax=Flavobacterium sp. CS20 TaxID=2775246 RepID=UPI001B3A4CFE|nr:T9SS type A sorting domain-containing protein [Flavobacterium sp. CS20]QTY27265.1 T9SS type A sorting domain-containing protein [Flavobacterium sp. CS20]
MKLQLFLFSYLFVVLNLKAQNPQLFQYDWRLESITTDSEIYVPSPTPNPDPNNGTDFDYLIFNNNLSGYSFNFGIYGNVVGEDIIFDNTDQSFDISNWILTMGQSSEASLYFLYNFILTEFNGIITNPFNYNITTVGDINYLNITNSIGEVATFYAANLSQEEFLKDSITFYPNPVSEVLNIKSSGIPIEKVKVYDLNGRLVLKSNFKDGQVNVSPLQKGIYILNIETSVGVLREKLVKE